MPPGCERLGAAPLLPATRADFKLQCDGFVLDATIQAFPARSTPSSLIGGRRRATAEVGTDDTTVTPMRDLNEGQGRWNLVQTGAPWRTTAVATWVRGAPAPGGLAGRLKQAQDSVFGGDHAAVLIAIGAGQPIPLRSRPQQALTAALAKLVQAQSGLTEQIAALSRQP
jgi:hypothetical protein